MPDPYAPLSPLLGRDAEISLLLDLHQQGSPCVCIQGPPGVGKTRLAREALLALEAPAPQAAPWRWVDLREAHTPEELLNALAQSLGWRAPRVWSQPLEQGAELLQGQTGLLVLDNCEQLTAPARDLLRGLLQSAPGLACWLTSQEPMGWPQERALALAPLPTPDPEASPEALAQNPAVALLVQLVRWRRGRFEPDRAQLVELAQVAQEVDGLPLALTMAAGRMALLEPSQVQARLRRDLGFLRAPPGQPRAPNHETLRLALEVSLSRLHAQERALWMQLAVFRGGFTVQTVEGALGLGDRALDMLESLQRRLLLTVEQDGATLRLSMYQLLRHFARLELARDQSWEPLQARHAAWFAQEGAARSLRSGVDPLALDWLLRERPNLEAALEHQRQQVQRHPEDAQRAEVMLKLVLALYAGSQRSGSYGLPVHFLKVAHQAMQPCWEAISPRWRAYLLSHLSIELRDLGRDQEVLAYNKKALALAAQTEDQMLKAVLWNNQGTHLNHLRQVEPARRAYQRCLELLPPEQESNQARVRMNIAVLELAMDRHQQALELLQDALEVFERHGLTHSRGNAQLNLALALVGVCEGQKALQVVEQGIAHARQANNQANLAQLQVRRLHIMAQCAPQLGLTATQQILALAQSHALLSVNAPVLVELFYNNHADLLLDSGLHREAASLLLRCVDHREGSQLRSNLWEGLALAHMGREDWGQAQEYLRRALSHSQRRQGALSQFYHQALAASVQAHQGNLEQARELLARLRDVACTQEPGAQAALALAQASIEVARWLQLDPGDPRWARHLSSVARRLSPYLSPPQEGVQPLHGLLSLRVALRALLRRIPHEAEHLFWEQLLDPRGEQLALSRQALRFRPPGQSWVDLSARPTLARLVELLALNPRGLATHDLIEGLYPEEHLVYEAGVNRIHKSLSLLRRAGLKPYIKREQGLYRLCPETRLLHLPPRDPWWAPPPDQERGPLQRLELARIQIR